MTISTSYTAPDGDPVAGVTTELNYPESKVVIPGVGSDPSVVARVTNLTGVQGLFNVGDDDSVLNVGLVAIGPNIPPGSFARAVFDCVPGQPVPTAVEFTCSPSVAALSGETVSPATCSAAVTIQP